MHKTGKELYLCVQCMVCRYANVFMYACVGCDFTNGFLCLSEVCIPDDKSNEKYVLCMCVHNTYTL